MEDIRDAHARVRAEAARKFDADPERIALVGSSAGGYLSPRPRAIVSFSGYCDISGYWATKPFYYSREPSLSVEEEIELSGGPAVTSNMGLEKTADGLPAFTERREHGPKR